MLSNMIADDLIIVFLVVVAVRLLFVPVRRLVNLFSRCRRPRYTVTVEQSRPDTKTSEREEKKQRRRYQAAQELERAQAEFEEQRELNDIIQERYETISEEKRKADSMSVENPALLAKYEKVLRQRITSQNKMRALQRNIEKLTDIANDQF